MRPDRTARSWPGWPVFRAGGCCRESLAGELLGAGPPPSVRPRRWPGSALAGCQRGRFTGPGPDARGVALGRPAPRAMPRSAPASSPRRARTCASRPQGREALPAEAGVPDASAPCQRPQRRGRLGRLHFGTLQAGGGRGKRFWENPGSRGLQKEGAARGRLEVLCTSREERAVPHPSYSHSGRERCEARRWGVVSTAVKRKSEALGTPFRSPRRERLSWGSLKEEKVPSKTSKLRKAAEGMRRLERGDRKHPRG